MAETLLFELRGLVHVLVRLGIDDLDDDDVDDLADVDDVDDLDDDGVDDLADDIGAVVSEDDLDDVDEDDMVLLLMRLVMRGTSLRLVLLLLNQKR